MRLTLCALACLWAVQAQAAAIVCKAADGQSATVSLSDRKMCGQSLSCVEGTFATDMTACAPDGKYSLSAPTGSAPIVRIVDRWQDFADHTGGVLSFNKTRTAYIFLGGFMSPDRGLTHEWTFNVQRLQGTAELTQTGKPAVHFTCAKAAPQL